MSDGNMVMHYSVRVRKQQTMRGVCVCMCVWGGGGSGGGGGGGVQDKQSGSANPENE